MVHLNMKLERGTREGGTELEGWGLRLETKGDRWIAIAPAPSSIAEAAGIREGDVILAINGVAVFMRALRKTENTSKPKVNPMVKNFLTTQSKIHIHIERNEKPGHKREKSKEAQDGTKAVQAKPKVISPVKIASPKAVRNEELSAVSEVEKSDLKEEPKIKEPKLEAKETNHAARQKAPEDLSQAVASCHSETSNVAKDNDITLGQKKRWPPQRPTREISNEEFPIQMRFRAMTGFSQSVAEISEEASRMKAAVDVTSAKPVVSSTTTSSCQSLTSVKPLKSADSVGQSVSITGTNQSTGDQEVPAGPLNTTEVSDNEKLFEKAAATNESDIEKTPDPLPEVAITQLSDDTAKPDPTMIVDANMPTLPVEESYLKEQVKCEERIEVERPEGVIHTQVVPEVIEVIKLTSFARKWLPGILTSTSSAAYMPSDDIPRVQEQIRHENLKNAQCRWESLKNSQSTLRQSRAQQKEDDKRIVESIFGTDVSSTWYRHLRAKLRV